MWEDPQFDPVIRIPEVGMTLVTPPDVDPEVYFADYEKVNPVAKRLTPLSTAEEGLLLLQVGEGVGGMGAQLSLTRSGRLTVRRRTFRWEEPDSEPRIEVQSAQLARSHVDEVFRLATEARLADRSLLEVNCRWQDGSVIALATIDGERAGLGAVPQQPSAVAPATAAGSPARPARHSLRRNSQRVRRLGRTLLRNRRNTTTRGQLISGRARQRMLPEQRGRRATARPTPAPGDAGNSPS